MQRNARDYIQWVNDMENMKLNSPMAFDFAVKYMDADDKSCLIGEGVLDG